MKYSNLRHEEITIVKLLYSEFHIFQISIVVYIYMLYLVDVLLFILHFNICKISKTAPVEAVALTVIACAHFKLLVSYILFAFY